MRRPTAAVAGTLAGTALLIGLKLGTSSAATEGVDAAAGGNPPAADGQAADPGAGSAPGSSPPASRTPGASTKPRTGAGDAGGNGGAGGNASGLRDGLFTGAPATNEYGTIRVTITVARGRLTKVNATYPTAGRSAQINARAIPALRQEALTAQSARIDTVSGASFTSASYRTSLQSALTTARA